MTLDIPMHLPVSQVQNLIHAELAHRDVTAVKVNYETNLLTITYERKPPQNRIEL